MSYALHLKAALLPALLATAACSNAPSTPAQMVVITDLSASTPLASERAFANRAASEIAKMISEYRLGDTITLLSAGEGGSKGRQRLEFRLTPQQRHNTVIAQVGTIIAGSPDSELSGQQDTALTFAIEQSGIRCHGRDRLVLITDGIESRRGFNRIDQVIAGKAELPTPSAELLRACKVTVLGIGIQADSQPQLNNEEMRNLKAAWRIYFRAAGVADADLELISIF